MCGVPAQASESLKRPSIILLLLGGVCFTLSTVLQPIAMSWDVSRGSGGLLNRLLGESRHLFANQFFVQADVSFHGGYYPSIFDQAKAPKDSRHMTAREGSAEEAEHEKQMDFLGPPRDWIERFGRNFLITDHTHLEGAKEAEILPWLKLSAELDPQRVDTYTVAAFWLRNLGKIAEAEQFLRQGLRNNPRNYELLFELGRLYNESYHDTARARNVWTEALRRWEQQESSKPAPDFHALHDLAIHLSRVEEQSGDLAQALAHLQLAARLSPHRELLQPQITALQQKVQTAQAPR